MGHLLPRDLRHATWLVNSATHKWGARRFSTRDDSTNNWRVAVLTGGEGWHNSHHAHPVSARHGLAWYELDQNYYSIKALQAYRAGAERQGCSHIHAGRGGDATAEGATGR